MRAHATMAFVVVLLSTLHFAVIVWFDAAHGTTAWRGNHNNAISQNHGSFDEEEQRLMDKAHRFLTTSYQFKNNTNNTSKRCRLTAVLMDPNIPLLPSTDMMYQSALESVAEFTPADTCLVLQTSACLMETYLQNNIDPTLLRLDVHTKKITVLPPSTLHKDFKAQLQSLTLVEAVSRSIYHRAGPQFRNLLQSGRVRVTLLQASLYNLKSCHNFYNPNQMWMSAKYYQQEFIQDVDSDLMLFFERDTFLCQPLIIEGWEKFAYVGAPWTRAYGRRGIATVMKFWNDPQAGGFHRRPLLEGEEYHVQVWRNYWKTHRSYSLSRELSSIHGHTDDNGLLLTLPARYPFSSNNSFYPSAMVGNGGLSLRSRKWMLRAITTCPYPPFAQLSNTNTTNISTHMQSKLLTPAFGSNHSDDHDQENHTMHNSFHQHEGLDCMATQDMRLQDDVYFSALLPILGALIPTPFQAQLFSQDEPFDVSLAPKDVSLVNASVAEVLGRKNVERYWQEMREDGRVTPIGFHKCWNPSNCPSFSSSMEKKCKYAQVAVEEEVHVWGIVGWWIWWMGVKVWLWLEP